IIMEGGSFTTRSIDGCQFHISFFRLRNACPLSRAGPVINIKLYSRPSDHAFMVTSRCQSGRTIVIFISARFELPCILSSAHRIISVAVCPAAVNPSEMANTLMTHFMRLILFAVFVYKKLFQLIDGIHAFKDGVLNADTITQRRQHTGLVGRIRDPDFLKEIFNEPDVELVPVRRHLSHKVEAIDLERELHHQADVLRPLAKLSE